jgi:dTDP-glucose 4,6-dehydratase
MRAVIPTIITQALTRDVVRPGALHPTRDLTSVTDTVRGFMLAAETDVTIGRPVNLGTNRTISIGDLAQLAIKLVGRDVELATDQQRLRPEKSEVLRLRSNNALAKELMGWEPQLSLEEGLQHTIDWIRDHLYLFNPDQYAV